MSAAVPGQKLALDILRDPATALEMKVRQDRLTSQRNSLQRAIEEHAQLSVTPAAGGTHLLLRTTDGEDDAWTTLAQSGVIGLPGAVFNDDAPTVRLCTAQPADVIRAAVDRVRAQ